MSASRIEGNIIIMSEAKFEPLNYTEIPPGDMINVSRKFYLDMKRRRSVTVRCTLSNQCLDRIKIVEFLEGFGFTRVAMSRCSGKSDHLGPYDIGPEETVVLKQQDEYFIERHFTVLLEPLLDLCGFGIDSFNSRSL